MLSQQDLQQIASKGITEEQINRQLKEFETGFPFLKLEAAAAVGKGIMSPSAEERDCYIKAWNDYKAAGKKVYLGAADTFRAAAVEQLCIWGERIGVPVIKQQQGSDPASVAFDTLQSAKANDADVVLIDTAGRLHNKVNLMNELTKIKNVMQKVVPDAPHDVMLVLDGSTGQNAFEQARQFTAATQVSSLAITKLDGTAKGGVVIGISDQFKIPVKYIGLGEQMTDLQVFNREEFVKSLIL